MPRWLGGMMLTINAAPGATTKMVPSPNTARATSSCGRFWASDESTRLTVVIASPAVRMRSRPTLSPMLPAVSIRPTDTSSAVTATHAICDASTPSTSESGPSEKLTSWMSSVVVKVAMQTAPSASHARSGAPVRLAAGPPSGSAPSWSAMRHGRASPRDARVRRTPRTHGVRRRWWCQRRAPERCRAPRAA